MIYTLLDGKYAPSRLLTSGDVVESTVIEGFTLDLEEFFKDVVCVFSLTENAESTEWKIGDKNQILPCSRFRKSGCDGSYEVILVFSHKNQKNSSLNFLAFCEPKESIQLQIRYKFFNSSKSSSVSMSISPLGNGNVTKSSSCA